MNPPLRIEILGPSAVGKSTLLKRVMGGRSAAERGWLAPSDLEGQLRDVRNQLDARERTVDAVDRGMPLAFMNLCFAILASSDMAPSRRFSAAGLLRRTCEDQHALPAVAGNAMVVHDELLLHRAFSLLPHSREVEHQAIAYFELVPVPDVACIVTALPETIAERALSRSRLPNCYAGLAGGRLIDVIGRALLVCDAALRVLPRRGVRVHLVRAEDELAVAQASLERVVQRYAEQR